MTWAHAWALGSATCAVPCLGWWLWCWYADRRDRRRAQVRDATARLGAATKPPAKVIVVHTTYTKGDLMSALASAPPPLPKVRAQYDGTWKRGAP